MDKIILRRPQSVAQPNLPHKSVFLIPRDCKSHIYGPWGPHQIPKTAKNTCFTAAFSLALLFMVKIILRWLQCVSKSAPSQNFISSSSRDCEPSIWAPLEPNKALEQPKTAFIPALFVTWETEKCDEFMQMLLIIIKKFIKDQFFEKYNFSEIMISMGPNTWKILHKHLWVDCMRPLALRYKEHGL